MQRCIELATLGAGSVSTNPMVGCVIVKNGIIIGEGWHMRFGEAHAEVNAVNSVKNKSDIEGATVYVNLEPCSHHGKTPPCADMLIAHKPARVVIGMADPFEKVAGRGIEKLRAAGIHTDVGLMAEACAELNRRFITFHKKKRPYIILKWAQTANGFLGPDRNKVTAEEFESQRHITGRVVQKLVHRWRTEEDAVMVGTNTALNDDPALNAREWTGRNPTRIVIDRELNLPPDLKLFDGSAHTIVFTAAEKKPATNLSYVQVDFENDLLKNMLRELHARTIQSVVVEGGARLLQAFIREELWDEAIVFSSPKALEDGIAAPLLPCDTVEQEMIDDVMMSVYRKP
jgi:diaminohydroxyphosphoribosylaminopyrimidine deaminase/5-amino-6-(5-phosphoribosylamino)uracil reductase